MLALGYKKGIIYDAARLVIPPEWYPALQR